jgi:hypothetical protein
MSFDSAHSKPVIENPQGTAREGWGFLIGSATQLEAASKLKA